MKEVARTNHGPKNDLDHLHEKRFSLNTHRTISIDIRATAYSLLQTTPFRYSAFLLYSSSFNIYYIALIPAAGISITR
jgi:hypothetical protein